MAKLNDVMASDQEQEQLSLIDDRAWKLDRRTVEVGRRGVAEARAALRRAASGHGPQNGTRRAA
jgi:hypothetical protein